MHHLADDRGQVLLRQPLLELVARALRTRLVLQQRRTPDRRARAAGPAGTPRPSWPRTPSRPGTPGWPGSRSDAPWPRGYFGCRAVTRSDPLPLAPHTTLRLGGPADRLVEARTARRGGRRRARRGRRGRAAAAARRRLEPRDRRRRVAGHRRADLARAGTRVERRPDGAVLLTVEAGEDWDALVAATVADGLGGLECLSGIPGRTGATPVQNVGAYGVEVADVLVDVDLYDRRPAGPRARPGRRPRARLPHQRAQAPRRRGRAAGPVPRCPATAQRPDPLPRAGPGPRRRARGAGARRRRPRGRARPASRQGHGARRRRPRHLERRAPSSPTRCCPRRTCRTRRTCRAGPPARTGSSCRRPGSSRHAGFRRGHPGPGGRVALSGKHVLALTNRGGGTTATCWRWRARSATACGHGSVSSWRRSRCWSAALCERARSLVGGLRTVRASSGSRRGECSCGGSA